MPSFISVLWSFDTYHVGFIATSFLNYQSNFCKEKNEKELKVYVFLERFYNWGAKLKLEQSSGI